MTDGGEIPDSVVHVPTGTSSDYDPTPDPRDMLRWGEDVKPMIEATVVPPDEHPTNSFLLDVALEKCADGFPAELTDALAVSPVVRSVQPQGEIWSAHLCL